MRFKSTLLMGMALAGMCSLLQADVLELKNGQILSGRYVGGTASTIRFQNAAGLQVVETSRIVALTFTGGSAPSAAAPAAANPKPTVTLPVGTMFLVRMNDPVSSRSARGARFSTKLEYDLTSGNTVVVPAGTVIYGQVKSATQARRAIGRSSLDIRLSELVLNGAPVPIATSGYKVAGAASIRKAARGAAAGAAIGAIVDGGDGAGKGAAIGAGVGTLRRAQTISIATETLLEFTLIRPLTFKTN